MLCVYVAVRVFVCVCLYVYMCVFCVCEVCLTFLHAMG